MAYSLDLRTRIIIAVERNDQPKREIAKLRRSRILYKLLRQKRERGDIAPLPTAAARMQG